MSRANWNSWAAPKNASGQLDHHAALTGDELWVTTLVELEPQQQVLDAFDPTGGYAAIVQTRVGSVTLRDREGGGTRWEVRLPICSERKR